MPLPSIRRASRRLGVASLIHPPRLVRLSGTAGRGRRQPGRAGRRTTGVDAGAEGLHAGLVPARPGRDPAMAGAHPGRPGTPLGGPRARRGWARRPNAGRLVASRRCIPSEGVALCPRTPTTTPHRHLPSDLPRPRQRLGGHQQRGPDGLLRPGHPRGAGLLDRQLQRPTTRPTRPRTAIRGHLPARVPAQPRGGDGLRRRGHPLRRPDRRVLLAPRATGGVPDDDRVGPLPEGTIGKTLAIWLTCTSTSAGPSGAKASARASSSSPGSCTWRAWIP